MGWNVMVNEEYIDYIIVKCLTNARIREKLSVMGQDEKEDALDGLMNPFEEQEYQKALKEKGLLEHIIENKPILMYDGIEKDIEKYESEIFDYEKRIFNNYSPRVNDDVPVYDVNDFHEDDIENDIYWDDDVELGEIEELQIDSQKDVSWTRNELNSLLMWHGDGYEVINGSIYQTSKWTDDLESIRRDSPEMVDRVISDMVNVKKNLTGAINKTDGLVYPTVLYCGSGYFDVSKVVGDKISFDGYTSTSFSKHTGEHYKDIYGEEGFLYKFLAPKGTKGISFNSMPYDNLNIYSWEHEYLLGRGTGGTIVGVDYGAREITVLLDE